MINKFTIGYIYKITSPSNRIYIGQTTNVKKRISEYKRLDCITQYKLYNSIKKYSWENHIFEIIDSCRCGDNKCILNIRERYWINEFNSLKVGLNCNEGGSGNVGFKMSDDTKNKIRLKRMGKNLSEEHKNNISKSLRGRKLPKRTEEHSHNISNSKKGKPAWNKGLKTNKKHSQETKNKIKIKLKNRILTKEHKEKIRKAHIGKKASMETIEKLKKPKSEEHKLKISISKKKSI